MNDHQFRQLKQLHDARNKSANDRDNYLRGLVTHGISEAALLEEIGRRIREGLK